MNRGLYIAATGAIAQMTRTDTIANNLANVDTTGFKKELAVFRANLPTVVVRTNDDLRETSVGPEPSAVPIGVLTNGAIHEANVTIHEEGILKQTGRNLDLAITGDGFFTIQTPQGIRYTRNGSFTRSGAGELVTMEGHRVLGQNGAIQLADASRIEVNETGAVFQDGTAADNLLLARFPDKTQLRKAGDSLFTSTALPQLSTATVRQGVLEGSNVQPVKELLNLLEAFRAYELNSRFIQVQDTLLGLAVGEVGRSAR